MRLCRSATDGNADDATTFNLLMGTCAVAVLLHVGIPGNGSMWRVVAILSVMVLSCICEARHIAVASVWHYASFAGLLVSNAYLMPRMLHLYLSACGMAWAAAVFAGKFPASETYFVCAAIMGVAFVYRAFEVFVTFLATGNGAIIVPLVTRFVPSYSFSEADFFKADGAPEDVASHRRTRYDALQDKWNSKFAKSLDYSRRLRGCFSDLRFASSNRVFIPFKAMLDQWCDPCTVVDQADRMMLKDADGHSLQDISGSYGVNVAGYDRYKEWLCKGMDQVKNIGVVLGPVHPMVVENIAMLQEVSGHDEVSFHMSGTEAVMAALRLVRFNKDRPLIVCFGGAYHGWWDGVQPLAGNERIPWDVLCLKDMSPMTLKVIALRAREIAGVVVNPLQSFNPNAPPPSDMVLASNVRKTCTTGRAGSNAYGDYLKELRAVCTANDVALIFDEVYTGFRLAPKGAQEYFDVKADMVVYGKTLGGGMPIGVVCSSAKLMNRATPKEPLRIAYVIGTFAAHPLTLAASNGFLKWATSDGAQQEYADLEARTNKFVHATNEEMDKEKLPVQVRSYSRYLPWALIAFWQGVHLNLSRWNFVILFLATAPALVETSC
jgi:glutamate-1-semialdehyde 2,1-aminomutase